MPDTPEDAGTVPSRGEGHATPATGVVTHAGSVAGYRIDSLAGTGGMGVVYRATDTELGRPVALKLIAPERAADPALRELFVRESLTAARLEHPNVIPIHRAGEDDGQLFIAMRFVEGASLQELIAENPGGMPPGRAARIVARVADALDAAHARGLVHRDVKPANVLIADPDGEEHVYLTDFGLSVPATGRAARGGRDPGWAGTLSYLAPEQIDGGPLDARTDVYALGCVLFHALTGRPPFPGGDEEAVLEAHRAAEPPAPSSAVRELPPAMDAVVRRAMAKLPEDRFATAGELGRAALSARYDVALLVAEGDRAAAEEVAASLAASGMHALVATGGAPATAEGVRASGACAVVVGRGGLGDWARTGLAAARELAMRDRAFRLALVLLPGAPDPSDPGLAYLATHPWVDLRAGISDALAAGDLVRSLRGADVPAGLPADSGECPYRGLEAFREEDAALYFGREQDTAQLIERLRGTRFVAVLGPSGSGKSSLVRAGLLPAVRRGAIPGGEAWRVIDVVPGEHPLAALAAGLAQLPGAGAPSAADLAADERALDVAVATALQGRPDGERLMVLVDQLEEAFTLCTDAAERVAFLGNLVYAATIPGGRVVVVASMRADFYHRLAEHPELRALVSTHQHMVGPMDARALRRAIEEPARLAGLELEPGLTRRILTDVAGRPGTLPLLEHLLVELWQRRRGRTLTLEAYAASGGVEGALARRANEVYGAMPPERQAVARRILLRLTQPGEGTEDTRRRAMRAELVTRPEEEADVAAVLESLTAARLITVGRDPAGDGAVVEVTHEALIRGWPELRGWLDEDRDRLRAERRLSDATTEWERGGREDGSLYRGARLLAWQERDRSALNPAEMEFLAASDELAERERATRRRRTTIARGALSAVAVVVAALATFAFIQRDDATDQRDVAKSRELAANAQLQLPGDPELSLLLAQRAHDVSPTPAAETALRRATFASSIRQTFRGHTDWVTSVVATADGRTIVSSGQDGTIQVWHPLDGSVTVLKGHDGPVRDVAMAPDGTSLASAGEDGTVRLWSADGGDAKRVLRGHEGGVNSVAFRGDGQALATAGDDGTVRLWRLSGGRPVVLRGTEGAARTVAFAPAGGLASSGDDGVVRLWTETGERAGARRAGEFIVFDVTYSPDGTLAAADSDGVVTIWGAATEGRTRNVKAAALTGVDTVSFSRDGSRFVTAGQDGTLRVWSAAGSVLAVLRGHDGEILGADFLPGGRVVSGGVDGTVRIWDWRQGLPAAVLTSPVAIVGAGDPAFTPNGRIVEGISDGSVRIWRPGSAAQVVVPPGPPGTSISVLAVDPGGTSAALGDFTGTVVVHPLDGPPATPKILRGHEGPVWSAAFTPDGTGLVTGGDDGTTRMWDLTTGEGRVVGRDQGPRLALAMSRDGAQLAGAGVDGAITLRDLVGEEDPIQLEGHEDVVFALGFSPDGRQLASGSGDRTIRVWNLDSGISTVLGKQETTVYSASFSPDGTRVLSAASDGVRVWDPTTGAVVFAPPTPARTAFRASFSPDGSRLAINTFTDTVRIVDCTTCGSLDSVLDLAADRVTRTLTPDERDAFGD